MRQILRNLAPLTTNSRKHQQLADERQVMQIDYAAEQSGSFKNFQVTRPAEGSSNFGGYQALLAAPRSRGNETYGSRGAQHELVKDAAMPGQVYKSTRSQAKRVQGSGEDMKTANSTHLLPYQVKLRGTVSKQSNHSTKSKVKALSRSSIMTPVNLGSSSQNPIRNQILTQAKAAQRHLSAHRVDSDKNDSAERTSKMPSLAKPVPHPSTRTKQNQRSVPKVANSVYQDPAVVQKRDSRGVLRHKTTLALNNKDQATLVSNQSESQGATLRQSKVGSNQKTPTSISNNVSRVGRGVEAGRKGFEKRNLSQLHSRTGDDNRSIPRNLTDKLRSNKSQSRPTMEKTTDEDSLGRRDSGPPSPLQEVREDALTSGRGSQVSLDNQGTNPHAHTNPRAGRHNTRIPPLNQRSELTSPSSKLPPPVPGIGSKLGPLHSKDSSNLKNISVEKRLKNSETAPDELSPSVPKKKERLVAILPVANTQQQASRPANRRSIGSKQHRDGLERVHSQQATNSRKPTTANDSFTGVRKPTRETEAMKSRQAEQAAKQQLAQLKIFRSLIDQRRSREPEKQPLDLKEFQIGLQVGQGAFAIVRRATHKQSKHVIAIKTYDKKNLQDRETQQAVHREINTLSDLWHPNIMKLHEVVDQRTHVHLIMELCQGSSIFHHIKKQPDQRLPEETCKQIFRQLVDGVGYMHSKGYAHRDLKLDNILMDTATKTIKIIDFGFSLKTDNERLTVYCGTPHYMDPDIVRKQPYNGSAADIWACGVILYIIFVGKLPFFGEFEADLFRKIQNGKFTAVPADIGSDKIRHFFKRIFDVNPNTRPTAAQLLEHSWLKEAQPEMAAPEQ